jgi:hypothetical protein
MTLIRAVTLPIRRHEITQVVRETPIGAVFENLRVEKMCLVAVVEKPAYQEVLLKTTSPLGICTTRTSWRVGSDTLLTATATASEGSA